MKFTASFSGPVPIFALMPLMFVPEPGTATLLGVGAAAIAFFARSRSRRAKGG